MSHPTLIAKGVKRLWAEQETSQAALARKAKLNLVYVSKLEQGQRKSPSFPAPERIARTLNCEVNVEFKRRGGR